MIETIWQDFKYACVRCDAPPDSPPPGTALGFIAALWTSGPLRAVLLEVTTFDPTVAVASAAMALARCSQPLCLLVERPCGPDDFF